VRTYGTIELKAGKSGKNEWVIRAESHVALRLKRVFTRVGKRQQGTIHITATADATRDVQWFMERYPLEFKRAADKATMDELANRHREAVDLAASLMAGTRDPRTFNLALPLRAYQASAAELALTTRGLLLADVMGLGKSATAIATLCDPRTRPALVVTMTHLPRQWQAEIRKFNPSLRSHIIRSTTPYDVRARVHKRVNGQQLPLLHDGVPDVLIINYHKLHGWAETLAGVVKSVIFDEVQELRRGTISAKGAAAYHIAERADFRIGCSGTPVMNYGGEIYNVIEALRPGELGTEEEFQTEWATHHGAKARIKDPKAFGMYLRENAIMLRRTRTDVARELPALTNIVQHIDCDHDTIARVESDAGELARIILSQNEQWREKGQASRDLDGLVRQATGIAKAPAVAQLVRMILEQGEKVVVYAWHRMVYEILKARLREFNPAMFTGSESPNQKENAKQDFIEGRTDLLLMSLRAGAGLDGLQSVCSTLVFAELDWSPGIHDQCTCRIHRDGQTRPVMAYYPLAPEGSDPIVADVLGIKRGQAEGIVDPDVELIERLDSGADHIRKLAEAYLAKKGMAAQ